MCRIGFNWLSAHLGTQDSQSAGCLAEFCQRKDGDKLLSLFSTVKMVDVNRANGRNGQTSGRSNAAHVATGSRITSSTDVPGVRGFQKGCCRPLSNGMTTYQVFWKPKPWPTASGCGMAKTRIQCGGGWQQKFLVAARHKREEGRRKVRARMEEIHGVRLLSSHLTKYHYKVNQVFGVGPPLPLPRLAPRQRAAGGGGSGEGNTRRCTQPTPARATLSLHAAHYTLGAPLTAA